MASMEIVNDQSVVSRVASLPLISSTYDIMSKVYLQTKDQHPYLKTVCDVAELGVKTVASVAVTSALPIIVKLEPQLTIANTFACKGLDKIEKNLPILHQPSEQIVATAKDAVSGAKDTVSMTVSGAKETVTNAVTGMVGRTCGAVQSGVSTVKESRVVQLVSRGVDSALSSSESLVEQYLPCTDQEMIKVSRAVEGFENGSQSYSYYVRLGSLSVKLRQRAYQRAVARVREARQSSQDSIVQLNHTMDVIEYARNNIDLNQKVHEKLGSVMDRQATGHDAASIESRILALARGISQQLQTTCQGLVRSMQGLPQHLQDQVLTVTHLASEVCSSFQQVGGFRDLSDGVLASSRAQLCRLRGTLDHAMDYLVNNTPLNWLVGPFYPHMAPPAASHEKPKGCRGVCAPAGPRRHDALLCECSSAGTDHAADAHACTGRKVCDMKTRRPVNSTQ